MEKENAELKNKEKKNDTRIMEIHLEVIISKCSMKI